MLSLEINEKLALTELRVCAGEKGPDFEGLNFEVGRFNFLLKYKRKDKNIF